MHVDVVDVSWRHAGVFEGAVHSEDSAEAIGVSGSEVVSVSREAAACYFGIDFSSASERVL